MDGRRTCYYCGKKIEPGTDHRSWYCSERCFMAAGVLKKEIERVTRRIEGEK